MQIHIRVNGQPVVREELERYTVRNPTVSRIVSSVYERQTDGTRTHGRGARED